MRNLESRFGEDDRSREGEESRDLGLGKKSKLSPEEDLRRRMDALSGQGAEKPETEPVSDKEAVRQGMDKLAENININENREKAVIIENNEKQEAEELTKKLKKEMGE